jgi:hypothetical protein
MSFVGHGSGEQQQRNAAVVAALRALSLKRLGRERARRVLLASSLVVAGWLVPVVAVPYRLHAQQRAEDAALYAKWARVEARCWDIAKRGEEIRQDMNSELAAATSQRQQAEIRTEAAWRLHHLAGLRAETGCITAQASVRAASPASVPGRGWRCHGGGSGGLPDP